MSIVRKNGKIVLIDHSQRKLKQELPSFKSTKIVFVVFGGALPANLKKVN